MTCNLFNGRTDPAALEAVLDATMPDVVAAQEVGANAGDVLERRFGHGLVRPADDCTGRALVANTPIDVVEVDIPGRPGLAAELFPGSDRSTRVLSVHLSNPVDGVKAIRDRGVQVDRILEFAADRPRLVVVGDLNASPAWRSYRRLTGALDDLVREWGRNGGRRPPSTWGPLPTGPALLRIDHVLGRSVRVIDLNVIRLAGGDHRAVVADVEAM